MVYDKQDIWNMLYGLWKKYTWFIFDMMNVSWFLNNGHVQALDMDMP